MGSFFDDVTGGVRGIVSGIPGYAGSDLDRAERDITGGSARYGYTGSFLDDQYRAETNADEREKALKKIRDKSAQDLANLQGNQIDMASDFNKNKNRYQGLIQDQEIKPLRMNMSQKLADTKLDASHRGILNSGIQKRKEADTIAQYKNDYFTGLDNARDKFSTLNADINEAPIKTGLELQGLQNQSQDDYYRAALQDMQSRNAALSGLGNAGGQIAGSYLANRNRGY